MRLAVTALALALLSAAPAAAQSLGSPAPPLPTDVDRFNGPYLGNVPEGYGLAPRQTAMGRLRMICNSSTRHDRRTCAQAWREINAAHAKLQAARQAGNGAPD